MTSPPQDELHAWLALAGTSATARRRARLLLQRFGGPLEVFAASDAELSACLSVAEVAALHHELGDSLANWARCRDWLAAAPGRHVLTCADAAYPAPLLAAADPPLLLFAAGRLDLLGMASVAIVGSRRATPLGRQTARRLGHDFSAWGVPVVSGLAVGIDAAAHEGALEAAGGGSTIAVVGHGLDRIYPRQHEPLARRIMDEGLMLSEHSPGVEALPAYFPQRNRVIAGLAVAVVVVEAALRSGSLITARLAAETGRDVFAVPGAITAPQSQGCNRLIKSGAGLLDSAADVIEAQGESFNAAVRARYTDWLRASAGTTLTACAPGASAAGPQPPGSAPGPCVLPPAAWHRIVQRLRALPCDVDELVHASGQPLPSVQQELLMAELHGRVGRLPGGLYQWTGP